MVLLKVFFEKSNFEKNQQTTKMFEKLHVHSRQIVKYLECTSTVGSGKTAHLRRLLLAYAIST